PTAHTRLAEAAAAAWNTDVWPGPELIATRQVEPSQCRAMVWVPNPPTLPASPTAHTSSGATAATPYRMLVVESGLGLSTIRHLFPFQCSVRVRMEPSTVNPTAHTSSGDRADTPYRKLSGTPGALGEGITFHPVPS